MNIWKLAISTKNIMNTNFEWENHFKKFLEKLTNTCIINREIHDFKGQFYNETEIMRKWKKVYILQ